LSKEDQERIKYLRELPSLFNCVRYAIGIVPEEHNSDVIEAELKQRIAATPELQEFFETISIMISAWKHFERTHIFVVSHFLQGLPGTNRTEGKNFLQDELDQETTWD
jgi:hypothetical protein